MNMMDFAERMDAKYIFPRPANEQFLSSYKAFLRLLKDFSRAGVCVLLSLASTFIAIYTWYYALNTFNLYALQGPGGLVTVGLAVLLFFVVTMAAADISGLALPYRLEFQRETYGSVTWARLADLQKPDVDAIRRNGEDLAGTGVMLAPFKTAHSIFLSLRRLAQSLIIYGPPGSGKSSTFFMPVIRQFAKCGGAVILDVKGELFNYTAHSFANVYRLDVENPLYSDWLNLFGGCYRNPDLARRIASYLVGNDANKNSAKEPIWDQSAVSMLAVMIMFLCEKKPHPTPRDIVRFLAENPKMDKRYNPAIGKEELYSPLNEAFENCGYAMVREIWGANFAHMPKDTFGSVKFNADTAIQQLLSPKIQEILRPPTEAERRMGRREIKLKDVRKMFRNPESNERAGTAVYVVVSPSDAMNMDVFLRVVFSVTLDTLRESADEGSSVLIALDEAGNVPLSKLPEGINTDRSKRISYMLGYQSMNQPLAQYGHDSAKTFLETAGINVFMPGIDDATADLASKRLGETTILQRSSSDAQNDGFDHEKTSETGRKLMFPTELTGMRWFTQCIITIKGVPPIRTRIPDDAKMQDIRLSEPQRILANPSEEVLRMLGMKSGREADAGSRVFVPELVGEDRRTYVINRDAASVNARDALEIRDEDVVLPDVEDLERAEAPVMFSDELEEGLEERVEDYGEEVNFLELEEAPVRRRGV